MKTNSYFISRNWISRHWGQLMLLVATAALVAACGGDDPTPTPEPTATVAPTATEVPAAAATEAPTATTEPSPAAEAQPESPLDQPESPLAQPESPLTETVIAPPQTEAEAIELAAATEAPAPADGFGTLSGLIWSHNLDEIVPGVQVYLVEADEGVEEGEFSPPAVYFGPTEEDVYGFANIAAQVQLENIPPGNYYLLVWTVYNWLLAFPSADADARPILITIEEGDQINLGMLYVDWP